MTEPTCARCGKPLADGATVCKVDARELAERLTEAAGHAEDAWTVLARQTRYGSAGGTRKAEPEPAGVELDERRNRVTEFGWAASIERPPAGALRAELEPANLAAFDEWHAAENAIGTWARDLESDAEGISAAALWLADHVEELRFHEAAVEAFDELHEACRVLARLVDRPADDVLVGMCDCGRTLYALAGRPIVACKPCGLTWDVERSRGILREHIDDLLMTAAEAAQLAVRLVDGDRGTDTIRKLIGSWAIRGELAAKGEIDGRATYRLGDILDRLARTPRRHRDGAAA